MSSDKKANSFKNKPRNCLNRRLYIAHLIHTGVKNVVDITSATGMPRRTVQDTIGSLGDYRINVGYVKAKGARIFHIEDWGPYSPEWIEKHIDEIKKEIEDTSK